MLYQFAQFLSISQNVHPLPYWIPAALARRRNQYSRGERKKKGGASGVEIIIKGEAKEIAALVLAVQGRQAEDVAEEVFSGFAEKLHKEINHRLEASWSARGSK